MKEDREDDGNEETRMGKLKDKAERKRGWMRDVTGTGGRETGQGEGREKKRLIIG